MHPLFPFLAAQFEDQARLQRNYEFLSYGLIAAWVILAVYVLMMMNRQKKLRREIATLRAMLEDKNK
jgi:CcmD family protein